MFEKESTDARPMIAATRLSIEEMEAVDLLCRWYGCNVSEIVRLALGNMAKQPLVKYEPEEARWVGTDGEQAVWSSGGNHGR